MPKKTLIPDRKTTVDFINERLIKNIQWYNQKSKYFKKVYYVITISETVVTLLIAFLGVVSDKYGISVLNLIAVYFLPGILVALKVVNDLQKPKKTWITYRFIKENLELELWLFSTRSGSYAGLSDEEAGRLLVDVTYKIEFLDVKNFAHSELSGKEISDKEREGLTELVNMIGGSKQINKEEKIEAVQ